MTTTIFASDRLSPVTALATSPSNTVLTPRQAVLTARNMAGLAPGTCSGIWLYTADAINQDRAERVVVGKVCSQGRLA